MPEWNESLSKSFWSNREFSSVMIDHNIEQKIEERSIQNRNRQESQMQQKQEFATYYHLPLERKDALPLPGQVVASNLQFWIQHLSWSYCKNCNVLGTHTLLPNYIKRPFLRPIKLCNCLKGMYMTPSVELIPDALKSLDYNSIIALRPFTVHLGDYMEKQHGYRQKTNMFRLTWSQNTVLEKIDTLENQQAKQKCLSAYSFLMQTKDSYYRKFVEMREQAIVEDEEFNVCDYRKKEGVECAIWPNL